MLALLAVIGAVGLSAARHRREAAQRERLAREAEAGPPVLVASVGRPSGERTVTLPGDVRAFFQATLYAKANGYVKEIRVDKGDRVKRGQVLAVIESPETDQQVRSAGSTLEVRRRNAARARQLAPHGIVSRQELEQAVADLGVAEADYRRLQALRGRRDEGDELEPDPSRSRQAIDAELPARAKKQAGGRQLLRPPGGPVMKGNLEHLDRSLVSEHGAPSPAGLRE